MPSRQSALPDIAVAAVRRYCDAKVPGHHRDKVRIECATRGKTVTIFERQPAWHPDLGTEWTRHPVAQLRYDPNDHNWRLYFADRNSRWHSYEPAARTPRIDELIDEIDRDPTGIFWG